MSLYIDDLFGSALNFEKIYSQVSEIDLKICPGTLELIQALDLVRAYCEQVDHDLPEKEILRLQEKILSSFDFALRCDPFYLPTLACRAWVCSQVLFYPHLALQDLNTLYRLRGYDKDIWVIVSQPIANAMSDNPVRVKGTPYFAFKWNLQEKDLYYSRSEMHGYLGHDWARIEDLKKAARLGSEEAIEKLASIK